jgi:hypothetical protein
MQTQLSEAELNVLRIIANLRGLVARANNIANLKVSENQNQDVEFDGLIGEYAFCKLHNLFLDIVPQPRSGSYDCLFHDQRLDIKSTRYKNGVLLGSTNRNADIDVYVLCIIDGLNVSFPGYAMAEELYAEENLTTLGRYDNPVYALDQSKLHKFKS